MKVLQLVLGNTWIRDRASSFNRCDDLALPAKSHQILKDGTHALSRPFELEKLEVQSRSTCCIVVPISTGYSPIRLSIHPNSNMLEIPARYA